jgi:hypothetical protein
MVKIQPTLTMSEARGTLGIAIRPTLLFVAAFALNVTPHEAVHAVAAYLLWFGSTLFQMWVNRDAETASSRQVVATAMAGPIFSLSVGGITWLLYKFRYNRSPAGLVEARRNMTHGNLTVELTYQSMIAQERLSR